MPEVTSTTESQSPVPLIIDGRHICTSTVFSVISPNAAQSIWESSSVSRQDALTAVEAAARAFPSWSTTKPAFRRNIFLRAADILERRAEECKGYMAQETGAQAQFTRFNIVTAAEILRDIAGRISGALGGSIPVCQDEGTYALVVKEPYGVVLGIAPWNAPYVLGIRCVAYALAAGNTCILKGSELSPRCFWAIGSVFSEAGLPDGCLNVIYHRPQDAAEITTSLIEHPAVKKINFTGSTAVGSIIAATAGRNLKPVLMELGGKNSAIICEDADLEKAAHHCALGAFLHAGQICMSTERILAHERIIKPFTEALKRAISDNFRSGEAAQTLAQTTGVEKNRSLLRDAVAKGATLVHGHFDPTESSESRLWPVVVAGVTREMEIYHSESFGPSVSLIAVGSDEEAIAIANDTDYGLSGAVFTMDLARGLAIAKRIETGAVHINGMSVHDEAGLPHGGVKNSGWGRFNAQAGFDEFLNTKTITFRQ